MIGFDILKGLLSWKRPGRTEGFVHTSPEVADAIDVAKHVALETIACIGDADLASAARIAIDRGVDVAWIGMAPRNVLVNDAGFTATVDMRIGGERVARRVLLTSDALGRIVDATSLTSRSKTIGTTA